VIRPFGTSSTEKAMCGVTSIPSPFTSMSHLSDRSEVMFLWGVYFRKTIQRRIIDRKFES